MHLRKIVCAAAMVACMGFAANAEIHPHAIGLRLAGGSLSGGEINYQMGMGSSNRLEIGGSFSFKSEDIPGGGDYNTNYFGAVGVYQWHWSIIDHLNWYVGPGVGVGMWSYSYEYDVPSVGKQKAEDSGFYVDVGGQIGIEYDFSFPLLLSIDVRPMYGVMNDAGFGWAGALGIRYTF